MKAEKLSRANALDSEMRLLKEDIQKLRSDNMVRVSIGKGCSPDLWNIRDEEDAWLKKSLIKRFSQRLKKLEAEFDKL